MISKEVKETIEKLTNDIKTVNENFIVEYDKLVYIVTDNEEADEPETKEELSQVYAELENFLTTLKDRAIELEDDLKEVFH